MLNLRSQRPTRVMRGSRVTLKTGPLISLKTASSCFRCSASVQPSVRNSYMVNGRPFRPLRCCRKMTGPGEVSFTAKAASRSTGEESRRRQKAPTK